MPFLWPMAECRVAARSWNILAALRDAGLIGLGDKGYHGYDDTGEHVITPYKGRNRPESQKDNNLADDRLRYPANAPTPSSNTGESCANSAAAPHCAGRLAKAILVLQNDEQPLSDE